MIVYVDTTGYESILISETILTLGSSLVVQQFLKEAAVKRKFQVMVLETSPL
jgi:translation initiation factor 2B subunit (eIF-2B alpha/beta/delta family)